MTVGSIRVGDSLPDTVLALRSYLGNGPLLVLFYSEANTPSCSQQLGAFRDDYELIQQIGASLLAISGDSPAEIERFIERERFPFPLLSDSELEAATAFGVLDEVGRQAQRAAFVSDADGTITLAIPFYQPSNLDHFIQVFKALGAEL